MDQTTNKKCTICGNEKPEGFFAFRTGPRFKGRVPYRVNQCGSCRGKASYQARKKRYARLASEEPDVFLAMRRKERVRYKHLAMARRYGITPEQYTEMYEAQNGKCAICFVPKLSRVAVPFDTYPSDLLVIDHCHSTNKVRGLLCSNCNVGIGHFSESAEKMRSAIRYIAKGAF